MGGAWKLTLRAPFGRMTPTQIVSPLLLRFDMLHRVDDPFQSILRLFSRYRGGWVLQISDFCKPHLVFHR